MATKAKKKSPPPPRPKALAPAAAADIDDVDAVDKIDWSKARFLGRGLYARKLRLALPLAGLRDAANKTQVDVAEVTGIAQSEISKIEHRADMLVSTMRRYIEALGGKLEIVAAFPKGHRI